jgi:LacI family transcriptional regulator, repressor for deo operon, udp, cdd, tsx, nupC, and nupG
VSIEKVAIKAGVSTATVSRAFNTPNKVAEATRQRVERVARGLAYVPNSSARTLRTQRSRVLGVVLPTLLNPVFAECLDGISAAAGASGYSILQATTDYILSIEDQVVNLLMASDVDGMILVVSNPDTSRALKKLKQVKLPYVLAYNRHAAHPCVSVDSQAAVMALVVHLAQLGHRRVTFVSGQLSASDRAQQRLCGFQDGVRAVGLKSTGLLEVPFVKSAVQDITSLLKTKARPTALVCSNDLLAIRCMRAAHLAGLRVPQDLSVVGFDGIALGEDLMPMLSTITQPNAQMGQRAASLLIDALAAGTSLKPDASITLDYAFREGESCSRTPLPTKKS